MLDCSPIHLTSQTEPRASPSHSPRSDPQPIFAAPQSPAYQPRRASLYCLERTPTAFNSEDERVFSSGDARSMDFQGDTAYDSATTRSTMTSDSGLPSLEIERLFIGSSAPEATKQPLLPLEEFVPRGFFTEPSQQDGTSLDGLDSLSTPRDDHSSDAEAADYFITPIAARKTQPMPDAVPQSPTSVPYREGLQLGTVPSSPPSNSYQEVLHTDTVLSSPSSTLYPEGIQPDTVPSSPPSIPYHEGLPPKHVRPEPSSDERQWVTLHSSEFWDDEPYLLSPSNDVFASPELPRHKPRTLSPPRLGAYQQQPSRHRQGFDEIHEDKRVSIFDWSEQQRSDRDSLHGSSPRPWTMHSKQSHDGRAGRASGRRAPNALHLRSQSVPAGKESYLDSDPAYPPAKFGTWGLGNKGVSEEWTDDFEFEEIEDHDAQHGNERLATGMKVPQAIIDRQASVHGQFGHVQEFMLLVEELKRLRHQGLLLDLMKGPSYHLWEDAENIINLATLNEDDEELMPPQFPDLPNGFDDFDEDASPTHRTKQQSTSVTGDESKTANTPSLSSTPSTPAAGRGRGDSVAQAKSFLQTMHQNRTGIESSRLQGRSPPSKLPFDTQDLRDLVVRAGVATRALKDIVREAEGVLISPERTAKDTRDPPFSQIFNTPETSSPKSKKPGLAKSASVHSYINGSVAMHTTKDIALAT